MPALSFVVNSATQITAVDPAHLQAVVDVTVANAGGTSATSSADQFSYIASLPAVTSINPDIGPTSGGTSVIVTGSGFFGASAVVFGTTPATTFTVNSPTQITATAPAGAPALPTCS